MPQCIAQALCVGYQTLASVTDVSELEAGILLSHVLGVSRAYLLTWPEKNLTSTQQKQFLTLLEKRQLGEPIAYLTGHKEFWSLDLIVTPDVLIPRADTELLVEMVLKKIVLQHAVLADLGTGSGAIALALAHERPQWIIHATDKSKEALSVAKQNAKALSLPNVFFHEGSWCAALPTMKWDAIVSNPPYVAPEDPHLSQGDLRFEPSHALVADDDGLKDLKDIILAARHHLKPNGLLFLEHGFTQAQKVSSIFAQAGYTGVEICQDLAQLDRVTIASWPGFDINYIP